jgi:hypothetical protein
VDELVGAMVSNPLLLIESATRDSSFMAVGGDRGGGHTQLGVTYVDNKGKAHFLPLIMFNGKDDWSDLSRLTVPPIPTFIDHEHIFGILQHLLDKGAFLNGDWLFLSAVLGHKGPASYHPCPICKVHKDNLGQLTGYRSKTPQRGEFSMEHPPLLTCSPKRIVPLPLHVFLGIGDRIIFHIYPRLLGAAKVTAVLEQIKTIHAPGNGGLADIYSLNGPELSRWIKNDMCSKLLTSCRPSRVGETTRDENIRLMDTWLRLLHKHMLHRRKWDPTMKWEFRQTITEILKRWVEVTGDKLFPKLHMLRHTREFAENHDHLGRYSEAPIESMHAHMNRLFHTTHRNSSHNQPEQYRRSLADVALPAAQPVALRDITKAVNNGNLSLHRVTRSKSL